MAAGAALGDSGRMTTYATNLTPYAVPERSRSGPLAATVTGGLGRVRIAPRAAAPAKPVFVGIARTRDVNAYLDQVQQDEIADVGFDPFTLDRTRRAGEGRPAMPAAQTFWAASSSAGRPLEW